MTLARLFCSVFLLGACELRTVAQPTGPEVIRALQPLAALAPVVPAARGLWSVVSSIKEAPAPTYSETFAVVHAVGTGEEAARYVLLPGAPAPEWMEGAPALLGQVTYDGYSFGQVEVRRSLALDRLPASISSWVGREVQLVAHDGATCQATIEGIDALGRLVSSMPQSAEWDSRFGASASEGLAWSVFQATTTHGLLLAARVPVTSECQDASFAVATEHPLVTVAPRGVPGGLREVALGQALADPRFAQLQTTNPAWGKDWLARQASLRYFAAPGAPNMLTLTADLEYGGSLLFAWEVVETSFGPHLVSKGEPRAVWSSLPETGIFDGASWRFLDGGGAVIAPSARGVFERYVTSPEIPVEYDPGEDSGC